MTWDWTLFLVADAVVLLIATTVVLVAFLRDLRRERGE